MSEASVAMPRIRPRSKVSAHRVLVAIAVILSVLLVLAIAIYGFDYYWLSLSERPFSPKHFLLKPSGKIGIGLGLFGFSLFLLIFLYPLRKRIKWLAMRGSARHWLDFHVVAGCLAPVVIMFHASFKFHGFAGLAFWFMLAVALSGIAGRYLYSQIPPTLKSVERSLNELEEMPSAIDGGLDAAAMPSARLQQELIRIPSADAIKKMSAIAALGCMMRLDLTMPFRIAAIRGRAEGRTGVGAVLRGFLPTPNHDLEAAIRDAKKRAALAKRVAFLTKTQQAFHLWHVVHRPFSYSFAVLAIIHIAVVISLGYL